MPGERWQSPTKQNGAINDGQYEQLRSDDHVSKYGSANWCTLTNDSGQDLVLYLDNKTYDVYDGTIFTIKIEEGLTFNDIKIYNGSGANISANTLRLNYGYTPK